ncbi:hypothetical protein ITX31_05635 [Arthrobacter gandavensis]|uniref:hypothetical protein n=1 Tax=Arthrobacter gandavensis TaxID=169960 RepID=UPI00188F1763|nr:hypothetical protein [Arthrobacter gandavensis]MBF4993589.1 hypothetical protein [Arthrobacter gandavensis]
MEIFLSLLVLGLLAGITVVVLLAVRHDGRGHLPPVPSGHPWHGYALWDVGDPRDVPSERPYFPRH